MQPQKALVSGGNGFIGAHLVDALKADGWDVAVYHKYERRRFGPMPDDVTFYRGDLNQESLVREALAGVDVLFHLLWTTTAIHEIANRDPAADLLANLVPTIGLLEAALAAGVKRVVFTSSGGTVYGPAHELPIVESHPTEPLNAYGVSKLAVEKYLHMFHHLHGLDYAIVRPSVPFGPGQNPLRKQGAPAVFTYRIAHGLPITIYGDGSITRDYFYIADLVSALMGVAKRPFSPTDPRIFNIGGGQPISLTQLVAAIEPVVGRKANLTFLPARQFDAPHIWLDTSRAADMLKWQPGVSLAAGLTEMWAWMSAHVPPPIG